MSNPSMSKRMILYLVWSLSVLTGGIASLYFAWSPYSDEERPQQSQLRGPTHK